MPTVVFLLRDRVAEEHDSIAASEEAGRRKRLRSAPCRLWHRAPDQALQINVVPHQGFGDPVQSVQPLLRVEAQLQRVLAALQANRRLYVLVATGGRSNTCCRRSA